MKWINHKITTFSIVFLLTKDVLTSLAAAAGSIIPDAVEGHNYDSERWRKNHRRLSHWLFGYIILLLFLWFFIYSRLKVDAFKITLFKVVNAFRVFNSETFIYVLAFFGVYIVLGAILHVLEDSLSSSVPVLHPTKRVFSIGIMSTGSVFEYLISFGLLFLAWVLK